MNTLDLGTLVYERHGMAVTNTKLIASALDVRHDAILESVATYCNPFPHFPPKGLRDTDIVRKKFEHDEIEFSRGAIELSQRAIEAIFLCPLPSVQPMFAELSQALAQLQLRIITEATQRRASPAVRPSCAMKERETVLFPLGAWLNESAKKKKEAESSGETFSPNANPATAVEEFKGARKFERMFWYEKATPQTDGSKKAKRKARNEVFDKPGRQDIRKVYSPEQEEYYELLTKWVHKPFSAFETVKSKRGNASANKKMFSLYAEGKTLREISTLVSRDFSAIRKTINLLLGRFAAEEKKRVDKMRELKAMQEVLEDQMLEKQMAYMDECFLGLQLWNRPLKAETMPQRRA